MLVTPPILEPFTLVEAKLRAGLTWVDGDPREVMLLGFIQAARSQVERDTGIGLLTQTHTVPIDDTCRRFYLPWRPVQSVLVETIDPVAEYTASPSVLDPSSVDARRATLTYGGDGRWPAGLRATIVVGFETVAELQAHAPSLMHAVGLLIAHYATLGRDLASLEPADLVPMGYADAIASYQLVVVP